jgi:hypothetical protein
MEWVPVEKLEKLKDGKLADTIWPPRCGCGRQLPYKKQVEQFKISATQQRGGHRRGLMQFEEPLIERQEIGPDGRVVVDWKRLDLDNTLAARAAQRRAHEPDDLKYDPILFDGR